MDPSDLNLCDMRAFCQVARCGGMSPTAVTAHLLQPAITQAAAKLKRSLQVTLALCAKQSAAAIVASSSSYSANAVRRGRGVASAAKNSAAVTSRALTHSLRLRASTLAFLFVHRFYQTPAGRLRLDRALGQNPAPSASAASASAYSARKARASATVPCV